MRILNRDEFIVNNKWRQIGKPFRAPTKKDPNSLQNHAVFECECGVRKILVASKVKRGETKSCGCLISELVTDRNTKHGLSRSGAYLSWSSMVARCTKENSPSWDRYGFVGVSVCDRWMKFENFYEDMGDRPDGMSIERKNTKLGYCPENCKWATVKEQSRNKKNNVLVSANNKTQCVADWAEETGVSPYTLYRRVSAGWTGEMVINKPVRKIEKIT